MNIEEARLYLEHTSKDDFNLEEHQKVNRYEAIQVVLQEIERLNKELEYSDFCNKQLRDTIANLEYKTKRLEEDLQELKGSDKE